MPCFATIAGCWCCRLARRRRRRGARSSGRRAGSRRRSGGRRGRSWARSAGRRRRSWGDIEGWVSFRSGVEDEVVLLDLDREGFGRVRALDEGGAFFDGDVVGLDPAVGGVAPALAGADVVFPV